MSPQVTQVWRAAIDAARRDAAHFKPQADLDGRTEQGLRRPAAHPRRLLPALEMSWICLVRRRCRAPCRSATASRCRRTGMKISLGPSYYWPRQRVFDFYAAWRPASRSTSSISARRSARAATNCASTTGWRSPRNSPTAGKEVVLSSQVADRIGVRPEGAAPHWSTTATFAVEANDIGAVRLLARGAGALRRRCLRSTSSIRRPCACSPNRAPRAG